jgi:hypothetical protein
VRELQRKRTKSEEREYYGYFAYSRKYGLAGKAAARPARPARRPERAGAFRRFVKAVLIAVIFTVCGMIIYDYLTKGTLLGIYAGISALRV